MSQVNEGFGNDDEFYDEGGVLVAVRYIERVSKLGRFWRKQLTSIGSIRAQQHIGLIFERNTRLWFLISTARNGYF